LSEAGQPSHLDKLERTPTSSLGEAIALLVKEQQRSKAFTDL
jgi:hypothetical protein